MIINASDVILLCVASNTNGRHRPYLHHFVGVRSILQEMVRLRSTDYVVNRSMTNTKLKSKSTNISGALRSVKNFRTSLQRWQRAWLCFYLRHCMAARRYYSASPQVHCVLKDWTPAKQTIILHPHLLKGWVDLSKISEWISCPRQLRAANVARPGIEPVIFG